MTAHTTTPLGALDAVVLDTETTGLDPRTARIVQIGAVRLSGGQIVEGERLDMIVNPGVPIPKVSTAVHGIDDAMAARAPAFADVAPQMARFIDGAVVIGHTIGYDMEILAREHRAANLAFRMPVMLDVRVLARLSGPQHGQFDLDGICAWLGIDIKGRHTATGDAIATAEAFQALVPLLRQRNIRTLAEALTASGKLIEAEARASGAQPSGPEPERAEPLQAVARIDSFPYRHRVADVMSAPPLFADATTTVADAVQMLLAKKSSSTFVRDDHGVGIVTERDVLRAIAAGPQGLATKLGAIATRPLHAVRDNDFVYRAIGRIERLGIRHLAVVDQGGDVVGAVTTRNLLRHRSTTALVLGDDIETADGDVGLASAWSKLPAMAASLLAEDVDARVVAAVISSELQHLTKRAAELAEAKMVADGRGGPPVPYSVLVLGSGGRGESLLAADQDNAIVYADTDTDTEPGGAGGAAGAHDAWFEAMATQMCATLDAAGVPFCKGGVMAKNKEWRMSVAAWRAHIDGWVRRQRPQDLLNVDIFFDALPVHGTLDLGHTIRRDAFEKARNARDFLMAMTQVARQKSPALGMFGRLRLDERGRIDLKMSGLMPIFSCARVLAIRHGIEDRATPARLAKVAAMGIGSQSDIEAVDAAHGTFMAAMLNQQLKDLEAGVPPSPRVETGRLDPNARAQIKAALGRVDTVIDLVSEGRI